MPKRFGAHSSVDRELSMFALGSQLVKDKELLTSVGIVGYGSKRVSLREIDGLNLFDDPTQHCLDCSFYDFAPSDDKNCNSTLVREVLISDPMRFCT